MASWRLMKENEKGHEYERAMAADLIAKEQIVLKTKREKILKKRGKKKSKKKRRCQKHTLKNKTIRAKVPRLLHHRH